MSFIEDHSGGRLVQAAVLGGSGLHARHGPDPARARPPVGYGDKIEHAVAFATLGVLGSFAYPRLSAVRLIVALSLFGAFIELAQATPLIHRDCDPLDWVADTSPASLVVVAIHRWRAARR